MTTPIPATKDLETAFTALDGGSTMVYWRVRSLVEMCWVPAYGFQADKARDVRDWAAQKEQTGQGFLTQKKFGEIYDYRITKATLKEKKR